MLAALEHQGERLEGRTGVTRGYSPALGVSPDRGLIEQIASLSGERMLERLAERGDEPGAETYRPARRFWPWLVGALLAWVLESALRRGWLAGRWPFARYLPARKAVRAPAARAARGFSSSRSARADRCRRPRRTDR